MKVTLLRPYGFCPGVQQATLLAEKVLKQAAKDGKKVYFEHTIVHNEEVEDKLHQAGDFSLYSGQKLGSDDIFLVSAHGHDRRLDDKLGQPQVVSAFCSLLSQRFKCIEKAVGEKRIILYLGQKDHPETKATLSFLERDLTSAYFFFSEFSDVKKYWRSHGDKLTLLIVQSTYSFFEEIEDLHLQILGPCPFCSDRQQTLRRMNNFKTYIIVGSLTSSNTAALYNLAEKLYPDAHIYRIAGIVDLYEKTIREPILLLSGTSATKETVDNIFAYLQKSGS